MSNESTEQRIKNIICDHYLSGSSERLTVGEVSARANISRQAFHKSYLHLKPFITGARNVDELLVGEVSDAGNTILKCQRLIRECQAELLSVKSEHQKQYKSLEDNLITTLMNGDILVHHSRELTNELKKKALHNEILKRQLLEKGLEVARAQEAPMPVKRESKSDRPIIKIETDISAAISGYLENQDLTRYYTSKSLAVVKAKESLQRWLKKKSAVRVMLFQNRYVCSFDGFIDRYLSACDDSLVVVDLPLAARSEVRDFIRGLEGAKSLEIYVPYSNSEAVINAQRRFSYRHIPVAEFRSFDMEPLPTIQDGFNSVIVYTI